MKNILALFLVFANIILLSAQSKVSIGMSMNEVKKIYPNINSETYENTITLDRPENIYGLDGTWGYRFEKEKLNWIFFHKYIDEINEANFKKCLSASRKLIKEYSTFYGNPDSTFIGDTLFTDPYKKKHWGYKVMNVRWKNYKGMKIKIEFTFMGGKGEYHFIVSVNYFDKNYPYYD